MVAASLHTAYHDKSSLNSLPPSSVLFVPGEACLYKRVCDRFEALHISQSGERYMRAHSHLHDTLTLYIVICQFWPSYPGFFLVYLGQMVGVGEIVPLLNSSKSEFGVIYLAEIDSYDIDRHFMGRHVASLAVCDRIIPLFSEEMSLNHTMRIFVTVHERECMPMNRDRQ